MSKLWTTFQSPYRVSVGYVVSVVLIRPVSAAPAPVPVLTRGPTDAGPVVLPGLLPPGPVVTQVTIPLNAPSARLGVGASPGDQLVIEGTGLAGDTVEVELQHYTQAARNVLSPDPGSTDRRLTVTLPPATTGQLTWPAGLYSLTVHVTRLPDVPRPSSPMFISLAPRITPAATRAISGIVTVTTPVSPAIWPDQSAALIFDDQVVPLAPHAMISNLSLEVGTPPVALHNVRLRVDGVESLLVQRYDVAPPIFEPSQQVSI
jgi:hypothetical protein